MKLALVLLMCIGINAVTFNMLVTSDKKADDKVQVDFYFESECNACHEFIKTSLKKAYNTTDFWKICKINLYPYGNAKRQRSGINDWKFTCQHGNEECQGNLVQTCAIRLYPNDYYKLSLPFIICIESFNWDYDWSVNGKKCATQYGLNWDKINTCSTSKQGRSYLAEMADATQKLNPHHTYVPWFVIDNVHDADQQTRLMADMVKEVCALYKGSEKIDACK